MTDPNLAQQAGDFAVDAAVDTEADTLINQGVDAIASHIPGGEMFEQQLRTEVVKWTPKTRQFSGDE